MGNKQITDMGQEAFAPLRASSVALLTSFRLNGQSVGTPVGIRIAAGKVYFTTWSTTGKVKRLAGNPRVTLAACTRTGKPIGPTVEGMAQRQQENEATDLAASVFKKSLWGQLWDQIYRLRGWQPVLYEVSPLNQGQAETNAASVKRSAL
jgi:PPOX class probable F420-dependent enzyme